MFAKLNSALDTKDGSSCTHDLQRDIKSASAYSCLVPWTSQEAAIIAVQLAVSRQRLFLTPFQQLLNIFCGTTLQAAALLVIPSR